MISAQDVHRHNTPDWLWDNWCEAYNLTRRIAGAHLIRPPLDITVKSIPNQQLRPSEAGFLPTGSRLSDHSGIGKLARF